MTKWQKIILVLILVLAFFLRFYKLSEYPVGFHTDEASLGYNAYSFLKTGRDENGKFLPFHIDMFGDFRPAGYQYLDILPVKFLGLNESAVRLPSALFGVATIGAILLLALVIFENYRLALLSSALMAFSPWHITLSRASAETIVALFFIVLGACFFILGIKYKAKNFFWAMIFWIISLFFYHSPRVFVPILIIAFSFMLFPLWREKDKFAKISLVSTFLSICLTSLFLVFIATGGTGRFRQVSIFNFPETRLVLEEQIREEGSGNVLITRTFHNKVINYSLTYLKEYFRYFSPNFLFIEGGLPIWYAIPNMGLFYLFELPLLLIGLYQLIKAKKRLFLIPIAWLLLGPMIAALTWDDTPNIQRSLVMLPAFIIIIVYGFLSSWEFVIRKIGKFKGYILIFILTPFFCWNFFYFLHQYFVHGRVHRPWYRSNGYKELVHFVNEVKGNYRQVYITKSQGGAYIHFLFHSQYDPNSYFVQGSPKDKDWGGFDKYVFIPKDCPWETGELGAPGTLYANAGTCKLPTFEMKTKVKLIKTILREDKTVAFYILGYVD